MWLDLTKKYDDRFVLDGFKLDLEPKKITCLLGVSGAGKTTILNILSGLTDFSGSIEDRIFELSYLFQSDRLLPNLTVLQNLEYALKAAMPEKTLRQNAIRDMLEVVGLFEDRNKRPNELSGGMAQRMAMARAFLYPHKLLLMDEPFRELDVGLRLRLIEQFKTLWQSKKPTVLCVTHDVDEAIMLADKLVVLANGKNALEFDFVSTLKSRVRQQILDVLVK